MMSYDNESEDVLAQNLAYYVKCSGNSKGIIADALGVSVTTLNNWLTGKKYPCPQNVTQIASYFGITEVELTGNDPDENQLVLTDNESMALLAKNLSYHIKCSGKTQSAIASAIGTNDSTLSTWVVGKRYPRPRQISKLANYFGITEEELTGKDPDEEAEHKAIFASNLAFYIHQSGSSCFEIAEQLGVTVSTIRNWVRGKYIPGSDAIRALAERFGIAEADLFEIKTEDARLQMYKPTLKSNLFPRAIFELLQKDYSLVLQGNRIQELRRAKGMTQAELGRMIGINQRTMSKYENQMIKSIPPDKLEQLAKILDTTPEYLLGWKAQQGNRSDCKSTEFTKNQQRLVAFACTVPDDKATMMLKVMQMIIDFDS